MKNKKLKRLSLINLISGYVLGALLLLLVFSNGAPERGANEIVQVIEGEVSYEGDAEPSKLPTEVEWERIIDLAGDPVYLKSTGELLGYRQPNDPFVSDPLRFERRPLKRHVYDDLIVNDHNNLNGGKFNNETVIGDAVVTSSNDHSGPNILRGNDRANVVHDESQRDVESVVDLELLENAIDASKEKIEEDDAPNLSLVKKGGGTDIGFDVSSDSDSDLSAYNFPTQGVGAGIGNAAIGAGAGSAGIGAGIGEAVVEGKPVSALGGVGASYNLSSEKGSALGVSTHGGVGGLVAGAGAGGAAGLSTGLVKKEVGLGVDGRAKGSGVGYGNGGARSYNYDHLPLDGALYIMMHVDGSGSILNTRKNLEVMRDTLLKDALLPYYNNDEQLYNQRVTIVDGSGERTLQFFKEAADKDNVLALVFQDEAQPVYHLPFFNKEPESHYLEDITSLKTSLRNNTGLYRGIMFQVDRGRTYTKSFKEFVENAWQGKGYLENDNLKQYYWQNNPHHIQNKDGIIFSDVYHAKDEGAPDYYLNLIFAASKKVGVDLNIFGAGLTDGKHNEY